jgi:hypothetical protein
MFFSLLEPFYGLQRVQLDHTQNGFKPLEASAKDFMLSIIWRAPDLPKRKIGLETELDIILKNPLIIRNSRIRADCGEEK